jgi:hypothetical protein
VDIARRKEGERFREGMVDQMKETSEVADGPADPKPHHRQPHMFDAGIGEQPLIIMLYENEKRRERE